MPKPISDLKAPSNLHAASRATSIVSFRSNSHSLKDVLNPHLEADPTLSVAKAVNTVAKALEWKVE